MSITRSNSAGGEIAGSDAPWPLAPGAVLRGRFELLEQIGKGGSSVVFRASDHVRASTRNRAAEVAIKIADGEPRQDMIELLHREADYLSRLAHPNIVRVHDADIDGATHFMVMELLRGRALTAVLGDSPERRLSRGLIANAVRDLAAALGAAHAKGVVHGDLKPGNVFLADDGHFKLLDFGAARDMKEEPIANQARPLEGELGAFTPIYASPEAIRGAAPTASDDVFSLSALIYVVMTGRHPFDGKTTIEALERQVAPPTRPEQATRPEWRAVRKGLSLSRSDRQSSVAELASDFFERPLLPRLFRERG
jgi:serine/threonine protein kinase